MWRHKQRDTIWTRCLDCRKFQDGHFHESLQWSFISKLRHQKTKKQNIYIYWSESQFFDYTRCLQPFPLSFRPGALTVWSKISVSISGNFYWQTEKHFHQFAKQDNLESYIVPKFAGNILPAISIPLDFNPGIFCEWFAFGKCEISGIFQKLSKKISVSFVPIKKISGIFGEMENTQSNVTIILSTLDLILKRRRIPELLSASFYL